MELAPAATAIAFWLVCASTTIEAVPVLCVLAGMGAGPDRRARVIANLPYNIATAVILRLIGIRHLLVDLLVMVQREVAERILSPPGRKSYGGLSVLCQGDRSRDGSVVGLEHTVNHVRSEWRLRVSSRFKKIIDHALKTESAAIVR